MGLPYNIPVQNKKIKIISRSMCCKSNKTTVRYKVSCHFTIQRRDNVKPSSKLHDVVEDNVFLNFRKGCVMFYVHNRQICSRIFHVIFRSFIQQTVVNSFFHVHAKVVKIILSCCLLFSAACRQKIQHRSVTLKSLI